MSALEQKDSILNISLNAVQEAKCKTACCCNYCSCCYWEGICSDSDCCTCSNDCACLCCVHKYGYSCRECVCQNTCCKSFTCFKCIGQVFCCIQACALPCDDEVPCMVGLFGIMCVVKSVHLLLGFFQPLFPVNRMPLYLRKLKRKQLKRKLKQLKRKKSNLPSNLAPRRRSQQRLAHNSRGNIWCRYPFPLNQSYARIRLQIAASFDVSVSNEQFGKLV